jgi:hypothetical protein
MDYILTNENIEFLKKEISKSGLTYSHLRDDLTDHVCCDVEYEMRNGLPFAKAYEMVKEKIGIEGLERIQHDTLFLINKKYRIMKKTMKISGLLAPIILAIGSLFKIQHLPGGSILMLSGFLILLFIFLPGAIFVSYKEVSNQTKLWTHFLGFLGTFLFTLSFLFKLMHWPGANIMLTLGVIFICLVFLPMVMINRLRDNETPFAKYIFVLALFGIMFFLTAMLFKSMHWPGASTIMIAGSVLLIFVALPIYVVKTYKDQANVSNSFIFILVVLVWFIIPITLMSLRYSPEILKPAYETSDYINYDIKFIESKNNMLFTSIKENPDAIAVHASANELLTFIQNIKVKMVRISCGDSGVTKDSCIIMSRVQGGTPGTYNLTLFNKDNNGLKLKELLQKFEKNLSALSSDSQYISIIKKTIEFSITPEDKSVEEMLMSLNKLTFLQLNICLAEEIALLNLSQQRLLIVKH